MSHILSAILDREFGTILVAWEALNEENSAHRTYSDLINKVGVLLNCPDFLGGCFV